MIAEMLCFWCSCLAVQQTILYCGPCGKGTKTEFAEAAKTLTEAKGHMLTAECVKPGEQPEVDWSDKEGFSVRRKDGRLRP